MSTETTTTSERWPLLARFWEYGFPHSHYLLVSLVSILVQNVLITSAPFVIGVAIDALFNDQPYTLPLVPAAWIPNAPLEQLWFTCALLGSVYLLHGVLSYFGNVPRGLFGHFAKHDLRVDTYDAIQRRGLAFFDDQQTGEVMSVLNNDVDELQDFFKDQVAFTVNDVSTVLPAAAYMALLNWQLMLITFVFTPVFAYVNLRFAGLIRSAHTDVRRAVGDLNARLQDNVSGITVIKTSATESYESGRVAAAARELFRANWEATKIRSKFLPLSGVLGNATYVLTFLIGGYWVLFGAPDPLSGALTAGELIPFLLYTEQLTGTFQGLAGRVHQYESAKAAAIRIAEIHRTDLAVKESESATDLDDVAGHVEYHDVAFGYDSDDPVVKDISLVADSGETVGLVGSTGAGKSTLVKLLLHFYDPDSGVIRIDDQDIQDVTLRSLRESIGYVSQEPYLFAGTVAENIAYGTPEADGASIRDAARTANAHEFVDSLPDGYDTEVGERGVKLSGGQRQRVAIARVIVRDPAIVVFDEATSHVDNETEVLIQDSMAKITEERTTFVIAHRLSSVRNADRICVLDDGEIIERGTHEELLDADGAYATLWSVQVGQVDRLSDEFLERAIDSQE